MLGLFTAKQLVEWEEIARESPISDLRADFLAAAIRKEIFDNTQYLVDVILASQRVPKHKRPKFRKVELKDFLLKWGGRPAKKKQTWQEQLRIVQMIVQAHSVPGLDAQ